MIGHIEILESLRDQLAKLSLTLRSTRGDSPALLMAWEHTCAAHTEVCMALDHARAAAGIYREQS